MEKCCMLLKNNSKRYAPVLKRRNSVYILSSKHTYRPMRARVYAVAQLFYEHECNLPVFSSFFHLLKLNICFCTVIYEEM